MQYLAKIKIQVVSHYWRNGDTLCRMHSTGGLKASKYKVFATQPTDRICQMCQNSYAKEEAQ